MGRKVPYTVLRENVLQADLWAVSNAVPGRLVEIVISVPRAGDAPVRSGDIDGVLSVEAPHCEEAFLAPCLDRAGNLALRLFLARPEEANQFSTRRMDEQLFLGFRRYPALTNANTGISIAVLKDAWRNAFPGADLTSMMIVPIDNRDIVGLRLTVGR